VYLAGAEIDHLTLDATGGHIFTGFNLHQSSFHHLTLIQRSGGYSIGTLGVSGTGLSTTVFDSITQHVYPDPVSDARSVPAWLLLDGTGGGKNLDVITFRNVTTIAHANAGGAFDNTQYIFDIGCTVAGTGGLADRITFSQCDFGVCLGGGIRLRSVQGVLIDQPGFGNMYNQGTPSHSIGNSLIYIGQYSGAAISKDVTVTGYVRENSGTITFGSYSDIEVDAATTGTTIITPGHTGTGTGLIINLNGSAGAQVISPQPDVTISNPAADTIVTGNGTVTVGTRMFPPAPPAGFLSAAPTGTTSVTLVMMGLGGTFAYTPAGSGNVLVTVTGQLYMTTAVVYAVLGCRYGTGTAPVNGAAVTGTRFGSSADTNVRAPVVGSTTPAGFAFTALLALTPATAHWFDLALATSNAADQANVVNISMTFAEFP
jgi:hypothetical protein